MISVDRVEAALKWIAEHIEAHATAKADLEREQERKKVVKAMLVTTKYSDMSNAAAENYAYADVVYADQLETVHKASVHYHVLDEKMKKEDLVIQVWRSINANMRRENV